MLDAIAILLVLALAFLFVVVFPIGTLVLVFGLPVTHAIAAYFAAAFTIGAWSR